MRSCSNLETWAWSQVGPSWIGVEKSTARDLSQNEIGSDDACCQRLSATRTKLSLQSEFPKSRSSSLGKRIAQRQYRGRRFSSLTRGPFGAQDLGSGAESAESLELDQR
jgi:hypothetical protein